MNAEQFETYQGPVYRRRTKKIVESRQRALPGPVIDEPWKTSTSLRALRVSTTFIAEGRALVRATKDEVGLGPQAVRRRERVSQGGCF